MTSAQAAIVADKIIYVADVVSSKPQEQAQGERKTPKGATAKNKVPVVGHFYMTFLSRFRSSKGSHVLLQTSETEPKIKDISRPNNQTKFSNAMCTHLDTRVRRQVVESAVGRVPSLLHPHVAGGGQHKTTARVQNSEKGSVRCRLSLKKRQLLRLDVHCAKKQRRE